MDNLIQGIDIISCIWLEGHQKLHYNWNMMIDVSRILEAHTYQEGISAWITLILKLLLFVILEKKVYVIETQ